MEGYTKLATLMGAYPEVAIVRRFARLNAQNILYLQAELVHLESRLNELEDQDKDSSDPDRTDCALDWFALRYCDEPKYPLSVDICQDLGWS